MKVKEIGEIIMLYHTNIPKYQRRGIIPEYPEGYKKKSVDEMREFLDTCRQRLMDYRSKSTVRRSNSLTRKRNRPFELPEYLKRAERENLRGIYVA